MKKTILLAVCAASVSAYALPTYEPFTEYSAAVAASSSNSIDLATGGLSVTNGSVVENWTSLNFSGTGSGDVSGIDVLVVNNASSVFTTGNLATLLPNGFPGTGSNINLCAYIPENTLNANLSLGNSAVLNLSQDITRPSSGTKTLFVSYLLDITAVGATGGGNYGRYCAFLASSNLVEGTGTTGFYQIWNSMFNTFSTTSGPTYIAYGLKTGFTTGGTGDYILATDSAAGNTGSPEVSTVGTPYNQPAFVVGAYVFTTGGTLKDTNVVWVNPPTNTFGGSTPSTTQLTLYTMEVVMSDVVGFCLNNRRTSGASGGVGPMYMGIINSQLSNAINAVEASFLHLPLGDAETEQGTVDVPGAIDPGQLLEQRDTKRELFARLRERAGPELHPIVDDWEPNYPGDFIARGGFDRRQVHRVRLLARAILVDLARELPLQDPTGMEMLM